MYIFFVNTFPFLLGIYPGVKLLGHNGSSMCNFLSNCQTVFQSGCTIYAFLIYFYYYKNFMSLAFIYPLILLDIILSTFFTSALIEFSLSLSKKKLICKLHHKRQQDVMESHIRSQKT